MNWRATDVWSVGISVSPCEDAARLGYDGRQINRIVIRMAQYFLDRNMRVIFGHDWREDGVMRAVADFAEVVAARAGSVKKRSDGREPVDSERDPEPRMLNLVPTGKKSLSRTALEACHDSGGVLDVISLSFNDENGLLSEFLPEVRDMWDSLEDRSKRAVELKVFRYFMTKQLDPGCRICLGGKTTGYEGAKPGVMEEAELALDCGKPLYLMGGFGGAARKFGENQEYWNTGNGLNENQKAELFETTDVERALRLIFAGIRTLDDGSSFHSSAEKP